MLKVLLQVTQLYLPNPLQVAQYGSHSRGYWLKLTNAQILSNVCKHPIRAGIHAEMVLDVQTHSSTVIAEICAGWVMVSAGRVALILTLVVAWPCALGAVSVAF